MCPFCVQNIQMGGNAANQKLDLKIKILFRIANVVTGTWQARYLFLQDMFQHIVSIVVFL